MIPIGETHDGRADMTNFEMDLIDTRMNSYSVEKEQDRCCKKHSILKPACVPILLIVIFIFLIVFIPIFNEDSIDSNITRYERAGYCSDQCSLEIIESIPTNLTYVNFTQTTPSTYQTWKNLLDNAKISIDLAVFYWNLRDNTTYPTSWQGRDILHRLINAAKRGVDIRIAQNAPSNKWPQLDSEYLSSKGYASVRSVDFGRLLGSGVLHTKLWIVDAKQIYLGSANMDWKSLTEVKELGYMMSNCACVAHEFSKMFSVYYFLGKEDAKIPKKWPINLQTRFNFSHPLDLYINDHKAKAFVSSSPPQLLTKGREDDASAITKVMEDAEEFVYIAVMEYLPIIKMGKKLNKYWPILDDAIRSAAYRGIKVRILISHWNHTKQAMIPFLRSLVIINGAVLGNGSIEVKFFSIPSTEEQRKITFARVNHNKYMVTDKAAYVGTSNWCGNYFVTTAGVGVVVELHSTVESLKSIFLRDWFSPYSEPLGNF